MKNKTAYALFSEIYELCTEQLDSGKYDSVLLQISEIAHEGKELRKQANDAETKGGKLPITHVVKSVCETCGKEVDYLFCGRYCYYCYTDMV